jgi:TonB family protein
VNQRALALAVLCCIAGKAAFAQPVASSTASAEVVIPPKLLSAPEPVYPAEAEKAQIEGDVVLELLLGEDGRVLEARVTEKMGAGLDEAALAVARGLVFEAARVDGVPVQTIVSFRVKFRLPEPEQLKPEIEQISQVTTATGTSYDVVVRSKKPVRTASDFNIELGARETAPQAGGTGADLLKRAPGFHTSQHSGEGKAHQIFLRGFDAVHGQDTEILAGGIPVNEVSNVHGQGYADLHFIIPETVLDMRVMEGTYHAEQGDFAVAGSIEFNHGLSQRGLLLRTSAGQYGLFRGVVAWGPEGQADETFVAAEVARGNGFGPARAWNRASAMAQALLPLSSTLSLRFLGSAYAGRFDSAGVVTERDYDAGRDFYASYDDDQGGASERHQALIEVLHQDLDTRASLSGYVTLRDLRLRQNFTGYLLSEEGDRTEQTHEAITAGGRAAYRKKLFKQLAITAGADWRHDQIEQMQRRLRTVDGKPQAPEPIVAGNDQNDVQAELGITEIGMYSDLSLLLGSFSAHGGVRVQALSFNIFDELENEGLGDRREAFGFAAAPKVSLSFRPGAGFELFASYGTGFRTPQALSLGQAERSPFTTVNSAELGARHLFGELLRTSVAGFYTHVAQDLVFDHVSGRTEIFGPTTRFGVALVAEAKPTEWLEGTLSITGVRATNDDTGLQIPFVPPLVIRLDSHAHETIGELFGLPLGLFGELGASFLGPRPLPFSELSSAVFVVEAGAGVMLGPVSLSIEVYNLLATRWRDGEFVYASRFDRDTSSSLVPERHFTAGRPFSGQATLTVHL